MPKGFSYDHEQNQVHIADGSGQMVLLSNEQALVLFQWLSHLFSWCQGCDQKVSPESIQVLTYSREVAPFRMQTAFLCPICYAEMLAAVEIRSQE